MNDKTDELAIQKGALSLRKSMDGQYALVGKFTNRWRDIDFHSNPLNGGEIVSSAAHEEFAKWLDNHPQHALELWTHHIWGTARKSRANWWGFTGNAFYASWPLTDQEAKEIANFMKDNTPGMSFGFYVFDYDCREGVIGKYRAFEASILPVEHAANPFTTFSLLKKDQTMALSDKQRASLVKLHGEQYARDLEASDENAAQVLDDAGIESKELGGEAVAAEKTEAEVLELVETDFATQADVVLALSRLESTFGEVIKNLMADVAALKKQLGDAKAAEEKAAKLAAAPLSVLAAYMPKSILVPDKTEPVKSTAEIDGRSALAKAGPKKAADSQQGGNNFMSILKAQRQGAAQ